MASSPANTGAIGKLSCRGFGACYERQGPVGDNSCIGDEACTLSGSGAIGKSACQGDRACFNADGPIAAGTCNGPSVGGKGVCEITPR